MEDPFQLKPEWTSIGGAPPRRVPTTTLDKLLVDGSVDPDKYTEVLAKLASDGGLNYTEAVKVLDVILAMPSHKRASALGFVFVF